MSGIATEKRMQVHDAADFGRVAVLLGGSSSERKISLDTGTAVLTALKKRGVDAVAWDPAEHGMQKFAAAGFDRAWIALHGPGGEDGAMQGTLQWLGIPYTGSGVMASALAMDKVRSKHLFRAVGINTPDYEVIRGAGDAALAADRLGYPLVLKPAGQGSSVGMSKVFEARELSAAAELALGFGEPAIVERCITGDEITVGVLQGEALPSIRIVTPRIFYDYRAKYEADTTEYFCPATHDKLIEQQYRDIAMHAFDALGCSGWGRVDLMAGSDGVPQVLEVNTVPGMTSHSLVPMAAKAAGIDFAELCWRILETSMGVSTAMQPMGAAANDA
ncbi:MAG: D-alanine--D-alanine ligase [Gammaproteobacteria bacterium]|nr:D-alanine--D-alanine ligase [Gammaproteobacteria bacterium]MDH4315481.1 D-alanine--D-alanine ligase [Gammaproteobacteria bacterium]MDH5215071.1 D-alanine--D-alanine ligase [Gammaproteobacteria bacterium]MDH5500177.1 D-alanine--D-alanine ligase [Gammaproteobacteria bacterium]